MALPIGWIREIAAGIAEGVVLGWSRAIERLHTAVEEAPNDADRARAVRMRDAVLRLPGAASDTRPLDSTSAVKAGEGVDLDQVARWKPDGEPRRTVSGLVDRLTVRGGG